MRGGYQIIDFNKTNFLDNEDCYFNSSEIWDLIESTDRPILIENFSIEGLDKKPCWVSFRHIDSEYEGLLYADPPSVDNAKMWFISVILDNGMTNVNVWSDNYPSGGSSVTIDSALSSTSTNPVQNKVVTEAINAKQEKLVSGSSIKTINSTSLLASGNLAIPVVSVNSSETATEELSNLSIDNVVYSLPESSGATNYKGRVATLTLTAGSEIQNGSYIHLHVTQSTNIEIDSVQATLAIGSYDIYVNNATSGENYIHITVFSNGSSSNYEGNAEIITFDFSGIPEPGTYILYFISK